MVRDMVAARQARPNPHGGLGTLTAEEEAQLDAMAHHELDGDGPCSGTCCT